MSDDYETRRAEAEAFIAKWRASLRIGLECQCRSFSWSGEIPEGGFITCPQCGGNIPPRKENRALDEAPHRDALFMFELERGRIEAEARLAAGQAKLDEAIRIATELLEQLKTTAQTTAMLAASAMSAMNVSGSLSGKPPDEPTPA